MLLNIFSLAEFNIRYQQCIKILPEVLPAKKNCN
jgi:hypothetical protein